MYTGYLTNPRNHAFSLLKSMNQKTLNVVLIIAVLILAGALGYVILIKRPVTSPTPQQDQKPLSLPDERVQQEGLKIYSNTDLGFQFAYPASLMIQEEFKKDYWKQTGQDFLELRLTGDEINGYIYVNDAGRGFEGMRRDISSEQVMVGDTQASLEISEEQRVVNGQVTDIGKRTILVKFERSGDSYFMILTYDREQEQKAKNIISSLRFE